jgi:hypothetical protein
MEASLKKTRVIMERLNSVFQLLNFGIQVKMQEGQVQAQETQREILEVETYPGQRHAW